MRVEELAVSFSDGLMLLPVTVEHIIDERSPLHGHNHDTLMVRPPAHRRCLAGYRGVSTNIYDMIYVYPASYTLNLILYRKRSKGLRWRPVCMHRLDDASNVDRQCSHAGS